MAGGVEDGVRGLGARKRRLAVLQLLALLRALAGVGRGAGGEGRGAEGTLQQLVLEALPLCVQAAAVVVELLAEGRLGAQRVAQSRELRRLRGCGVAQTLQLLRLVLLLAALQGFELADEPAKLFPVVCGCGWVCV